MVKRDLRFTELIGTVVLANDSKIPITMSKFSPYFLRNTKVETKTLSRQTGSSKAIRTTSNYAGPRRTGIHGG